MNRPALELTGAQESNLDIVRGYHQLSKHSFYAYAPGPETLDWDNQPNPFRAFADSEKFALSLANDLPTRDYFEFLTSPVEPLPVNFSTLSSFLRYALSVTAWKQYGPDKWSLRVNPSSGNLHPTESYLLLSHRADDLGAGLYHYNPEFHQLEKRADIEQPFLPEDCFAIALSSVMWRELWKYGERGFRYTQLDTGHAISALCYSARAHGWQLAMVRPSGAGLGQWLGLQRDEYRQVESEMAECLLCVGPESALAKLDASAITLPETKNWSGKPSRLGERSLYRWREAEQVAIATEELDELEGLRGEQPSKVLLESCAEKAVSNPQSDLVRSPNFQQVVLQRRSAQAFNGTGISGEEFYALVEALLANSQPLFGEASTASSPIHLVFAIHQVAGLQPGLYLLPTQVEKEALLKAECRKWPNWKKVDEFGTDKLPLLQLKEANVRKAAATLCCQQAIASDSAFTVGFLAEFDSSLAAPGVEGYRHLFWQAGILSHQLYLQATALNLAATGIGCFYDDPWHGLLGIENTSLQMLYLTAVGSPQRDDRLTSMSGYYHLKSAGQG